MSEISNYELDEYAQHSRTWFDQTPDPRTSPASGNRTLAATSALRR